MVTEPSPEYLDLKARAAASNLDSDTLLATDYLNHFNEIVMLLEMVPDMPEIMEEVKAVRQLDNVVVTSVQLLERYIEAGDQSMLREQATVMSRMIQRLLDTASGIIHGATKTMDQEEIDAIIAT